jgi:hypothetical protein
VDCQCDAFDSPSDDTAQHARTFSEGSIWDPRVDQRLYEATFDILATKTSHTTRKLETLEAETEQLEQRAIANSLLGFDPDRSAALQTEQIPAKTNIPITSTSTSMDGMNENVG